MRIIVTGATGFIGTSLCNELLNNGHEVIAVVRPGSSKKDKLGQCEGLHVIECALSELDKLLREVKTADVFYHLAWNGSAGAEREDYDIQMSNLEYTRNAILAAKELGAKKFIGAGSQAEYGVVRERAFEDETVPKPFMMYGAAKNAAYQMGRVLSEQIGINFVWPRIYSVYGVGENPGTLVNYVIDSLREGKTPDLSPCENTWNFMYITDCVRALRFLGEKDVNGIYHIASKDTRPLKEFVNEIRNIVAPESNINFGARTANPDRTFWLEPDVKKLTDLGFECAVSYADGIRNKLME